MDELISRGEAIIALVDEVAMNYNATSDLSGMMRAIKVIKGIPSVEPERKKGEWITSLDDTGEMDYECSKCGWHIGTDILVPLGYKYCPNCGADMREEK